MRLRDALDLRQQYEAKLGDRISGGGQADVYRLTVRGAPWGADRLLLKRYRVSPESSAGRHLIEFVRLVAATPALQTTSLVSLPRAVVIDEGQNLVGCIIPEFPGVNLADPRIFDDILADPRGLSLRLRLAATLAQGISLLHTHGIVHADISGPNAIVDLASVRAGILDADGGGVLHGPLGPEYRDGLTHLVRGRFEQSWLAPELVRDPPSSPSLASDRWALAVLIHALLFGGLDPFFHAATFADVAAGYVCWPPPTHVDPAVQAWVAFHAAERRRLGVALLRLFATTFNPSPSGDWQPSRRIRADTWGHELELASRWVVNCLACGEAFVAAHVRLCPWCQVVVPHPQVWTNRAGIELDRDGKTILGCDVGFTDRQGRYEVALFRRDGTQLLLIPRVELNVDGQRAEPDRPIPLLLQPSRHHVRVWSADRRQEAEFRVEIPA